MKRLVAILILFLLSTSQACASIVQINKHGDVVWNVLSIQTSVDRSDLEIKEASGERTDLSLLLEKNDEKIVLNIGDSKQLDVTGWSNELIEIEERGDVNKINISVKDGKFIIGESDISAYTEFPIRVDPRLNELSVVTDSGSTYLSVLPKEAVETSFRTRYMTKLTDNNIEIKEDGDGVLAYNIKGEKEVKLLNLIDLKVPVTMTISAATGEVLKVDRAPWMVIIDFLFG